MAAVAKKRQQRRWWEFLFFFITFLSAFGMWDGALPIIFQLPVPFPPRQLFIMMFETMEGEASDPGPLPRCIPWDRVLGLKVLVQDEGAESERGGRRGGEHSARQCADVSAARLRKGKGKKRWRIWHADISAKEREREHCGGRRKKREV